MGKKSTKIQILEREVYIQDLMAKGMRPGEIFENVAEKYGLVPRSVEKQYYSIVDKMAKKVDEGRNELRSQLMLRNDKIFREAMDEKLFKVALDANAAQAKLGGLNEAVAQKDSLPEVLKFEEEDFSGIKLVKEKSEEETG